MSDTDRRKLAMSGMPTNQLPIQRPSAPLMGEVVGPYRLMRAIGAGGSARIDLARLERAYDFQRHVVIKRPLEHLRGDRQVAASLRREARIGGRLRHPNLVAVLDAGQHDGYDYLALEYIHGCSLRILMQTEQPGVVRDVPLPVALSIAIDIARGLHDAHELTDEHGSPLGLVHRDVSPGNVLLGGDGAVKVSDFGIAKETRVSTLSGTLHGTVTYMAPEQCRGHAFDRRADLFSIGVILWELVTHTRLFLADNDVASLHRVLTADVTRPRQLRPELSLALEDIIMTALAHDPDKRFGSARALADALEAFAASDGHIVGARRIARTVEEAIGARDVPWIASTTMAEMPVAVPAEPRRSEGSLVAVIESLAVDVDAADSVPTFGPIDERSKGKEEGWVPSLPPHIPTTAQVAPLPRHKPRGRRVWMIGGGALLGAIAGIVSWTMVGSGPHDGAVVPPPAVEPPAAAAVPAQGAAPTAAAAREHASDSPTLPAPTPTIEPTIAPATPSGLQSGLTHTAGGGSSTHRHRHPVLTKPLIPLATAPSPTAKEPVASGSSETPNAAPTEPQPAPRGSGSSVEWNPDMLLPPDSPGRGSSTGSARPPSK